MSLEPSAISLNRRTTQGDIAKAAGVHNTTVSLALRNSPAIPEATRRRIQELAEKMGYHPDPALRALVAYRNGRVKRDRVEVIAYITGATSKTGEGRADEQFYRGAQRRAEHFGYQLERFSSGEGGMSGRRLSDMLYHRGITGVIAASHRDGGQSLVDFDWSRVAAVKFGALPGLPALHRVIDDPRGAIRLAFERITAAGYRRIGCMLPAAWDAWDEGLSFSREIMRAQAELPSGQRLPIFFHGEDAPGRKGAAPSDLARLATWLNHHRPEVVLGSCFGAELLGRAGVVIPDDLRFADLFLEGAEGRVAGVRQNRERVGELAVELLAAQKQENLLGAPAVPTTTTVESIWCEGESLPMAMSNWAAQELLASGQ